MLIMSVLIAIILLLYIYRIFVFASIWFFFDRGWVFVFLYIVFFFVILKVGICRDLVFLSYRGIFRGCLYLFFFGRGVG